MFIFVLFLFCQQHFENMTLYLEQNFTHLSSSIILNLAVISVYIHIFYVKLKGSYSCTGLHRP